MDRPQFHLEPGGVLADPCQKQRNTLESREAERHALQQGLQNASTQEKPEIAGQIKALNKQITKSKAALDFCRSLFGNDV